MELTDILNIRLGFKYLLNMLLIHVIAKYGSPVYAKLVGAALLAKHTANLLDVSRNVCDGQGPSLECTRGIAENVLFCICFFVGSLSIVFEQERKRYRGVV